MSSVHQRWVEAVNRRDLDSFGTLYAPNAITHDPAYQQPVEGRESVRNEIDSFIRAFPDLQVKVTSAIESDASYAVEAIFTGTHDGPLPTDAGEIPPSGRSIQLPAAGFYRLDGQGRILEENRYYDLSGLLSQLGVTS